jgi:DNA polymerase-3 subunit epsilon
MITVFDTETTGRFINNLPIDHPSQPRMVSLAAVAFSEDGQQEIHSSQYIIKPDGFVIPPEATAVHGITHEFAMEHGLDARVVIATFTHVYVKSRLAMTFNWEFDSNMVRRECSHYNMPTEWFSRAKGRCVMLAASAAMKLPNEHGYPGYAWPKLAAAYEWFFKQKLEGAHNSMVDTRSAAWLAFGMRNNGYWDIEKAA